MAQAKKTKPKATKKTPKSKAKKSVSTKRATKKLSNSAASKPVKRASKPRATKKALTVETRRKLLRPRTDYEQLIEQLAVTWEQNTVLRVPNLTAARLRKLGRDALRAVTKETSLRAKLERQLETVHDVRLIAEDGLWRAVLDLNAAVKLFARSDETLPERFAFLIEALTPTRAAIEPVDIVEPLTPTP